MSITKIFNYLKPIWSGEDGKPSLRAIAAIFLIYNFIGNINWAMRKWKEGTSFEGLSLVLGIEAGLITALLGLTAWSNMTSKRIDSVAFGPPPSPNITVQKAETVTNSGPTTNVGIKEPEDDK